VNGFLRIVARLKKLTEQEKLINLGVGVFLVDTPLAVKRVNVDLYHELDKIDKRPIYLLVNKMIHEEDVPVLKEILIKAKDNKVSGIVAADLTVMVVAKELGMNNLVIYQPGTMNTNSFDNQYFSQAGIKGLTISKEITLDEIKNICENHTLELSLVGHGYLDMFYSRRKLLSNYFIYKGVNRKNVKENDSFRLKEEMRSESLYPIFEDDGGTHVFRDKALESFVEVSTLKDYLSDFFVERIFMADEEYYDSLSVYNDFDQADAFLEKYGSKYNKGFYYQYTEKLKGELDEN